MELLTYLVETKGTIGSIWLITSILALAKTLHLTLKRKGDISKHF